MAEDNLLEKYLRETNFPDAEDVDSLPDRAVGIVRASIIDDRLTVAIRSHLRPDSTLAEEMLGERGRIGEFGTKIDIGYLLGLYDKRDRKALHAVREIRNKFAHLPGRVSFEDKVLAKFITDLEFVRALFWDVEWTARTQFIEATAYLLGTLMVCYRGDGERLLSRYGPPPSPDKPVRLSTPKARPATPRKKGRGPRRGSSSP